MTWTIAGNVPTHFSLSQKCSDTVGPTQATIAVQTFGAARSESLPTQQNVTKLAGQSAEKEIMPCPTTLRVGSASVGISKGCSMLLNLEPLQTRTRALRSYGSSSQLLMSILLIWRSGEKDKARAVVDWDSTRPMLRIKHDL